MRQSLCMTLGGTQKPALPRTTPLLPHSLPPNANTTTGGGAVVVLLVAVAAVVAMVEAARTTHATTFTCSKMDLVMMVIGISFTHPHGLLVLLLPCPGLVVMPPPPITATPSSIAGSSRGLVGISH